MLDTQIKRGAFTAGGAQLGPLPLCFPHTPVPCPGRSLVSVTTASVHCVCISRPSWLRWAWAARGALVVGLLWKHLERALKDKDPLRDVGVGGPGPRENDPNEGGGSPSRKHPLTRGDVQAACAAVSGDTPRP